VRLRSQLTLLLALLLALFAGNAEAAPQAFAVELEGLGKMAFVGEDGPDAVRRFIDGLVRRRAFPGKEKELRAWGRALAQKAVGAPTVASLRTGDKPIIGIQLGYEADLLGEPNVRKTRRNYKRAVVKAGGDTIFLPPAASMRQIDTLLDAVDHVLLAGGQDIHPKLYGQEVTHANAVDLNLVRDKYERRLARKALARRIGVDGICRGCQMLNVAAGGTLTQDLNKDGVTSLPHIGPNQTPIRHAVLLDEKSAIKKVVGAKRISSAVSLHHQAVDKVAPGWKVVALSPDGVPEGLEKKRGGARCYQFHPERSGKAGFSKAIFKDMVGRAGAYAKLRR
jgi:putative glutamine amidotransferase